MKADAVDEEDVKANEEKPCAMIRLSQYKATLSTSQSPHEEIDIKKASCNSYHYDNANAIDSSEELTKEMINDKLKKLYLLKAKYNSKENDYYITQLNVHQLLKEAQLYKTIPLGHIDLLFKQACGFKSKMNFLQFTNFMIRLSRLIYPIQFKANPKGTLERFLRVFFEKFSHCLSNSANTLDVFKEGGEGKDSPGYILIERLIAYMPDDAQRFIVFKLEAPLRELYEVYFCNPMFYSIDCKGEDMRQTCLRILLVFAKDFEIIPFVMSETLLVIYYNMIVNMNYNMGDCYEENSNDMHQAQMSAIKKASFNHLTIINTDEVYFTFDNFRSMLIHLAIHAYYKVLPNKFKESEVDKLILFLERLDESKGMSLLGAKFQLRNSPKITLHPSRKWLIEYNELIAKEDQSKWHINNGLQSSSSIDHANDHAGNGMIDIKEVQSNDGRHELIEKHADDLSRTFLYFSGFGNKLNFNQMNLSSYFKFLCHCKLMFPKKDAPYNNLNSNSNRLQTDEAYLQLFQYSPKSITTQASNGLIKERDVSFIFTSLTGLKPIGTPHQSASLLQKNSLCSSSVYTKSNSTGSLTSALIQQPQAQQLQQKLRSESQLYQMDFNQFVSSFALLSQFIYPKETQETALYQLLTINIIPHLIKRESAMKLPYCNRIASASLFINRDDVRTFLSKLSNVLSPYYNCYSNEDNEMDFSHFYEFFKDFDVFPEMINLVLLKNVFYFLNESKRQDEEEECVNARLSFEHFLDSIALCAMLFEFDRQFDPMEKIIFIIERINRSNGVEKCRKKSGRQL